MSELASGELIVLLDESGCAVGVAPKLASHHEDTPLHLAFTAYAFDSDGRLLLTRRSAAKKTWPGVWTNTCCGHPGPGEPLADAVARRVRAELGCGLTRADVVVDRIRYRAVMENGTAENEMGPVLRILLDGPVAPDPDETDQVRWVEWADLVRQVEAGTAGLSPWSEITIRQLAGIGDGPWAWPVVDPTRAIPALGAQHPHRAAPDQDGSRKPDDSHGTTGTRAPGAREILTSTRARIDPAYQQALEVLPARARHVLGYHVGWWEHDGSPATSTGKAFAPALTFLCARIAGGPDSEKRALGAAVAVEMVHDASLIHDDISDDDRMRRHRRAAWDVFGTGVALSAATCLFPLAADQLRDRDDVAELDRAIRETYEGQVDDCSFERRDDVTLAEYLVMVEKKVGALMAAACVLGARAGGATETRQEHYRAFGRHLGTAYMVSDDLLGIWSDSSVSGKPRYSDLITRKKTAPVLEAITRSREIRRLYAGDTPLDAAVAARIAVLIEECGARAWAEGEAERWLVLALDSLDSAASGAADREALTALRTLAHAAVRRNR